MLQRIGRYEVLETLAGGGQGTVYLGREEGSEGVVAIKVMHPGHTRRTQKPVGVTPCQFDPPSSPRPLSHIGQFCDPIFNAQQSNAGRQQNMGIGRWSRHGLPRSRYRPRPQGIAE